MKRIILLAFMGMFMLATAQAQFRIGAKVGLSTISVSDDDLSVYMDNNPIGFYLGPAVEYWFKGGFTLESSLLYAQRGIHFEGEDTRNFGYIEIPLDAKYIYAINDKISLYGSVGPYFNFRVAGNSGFTVAGDSDTAGEWEANTFGVGLGVSGGIELFKRVQLGTSYNMSFSDDFKQAGGGYKAKSRVWSITAAYFF